MAFVCISGKGVFARVSAVSKKKKSKFVFNLLLKICFQSENYKPPE